MITTPQLRVSSRHEIPVRKPDFHFDASMPVLWFRDNAFLTFLFNGFNLTFPEGERMFVRAVQDHKDRISDPELLIQIEGFSGQEGAHAAAHQRLFDALRDQGFDLDEFFRDYDAFMRHVRTRPAALRLASTAALEHYTATLATLLFETDLLEGVEDEMRRLLVWHATEELEHRSVAFDVFVRARGSYPLRMWGFAIASIQMFYWIIRGMRLFGRQSGVPVSRVWRDFLATGAHVSGTKLLATVFAYLKPDHHPSEMGSIESAHARMRAEGLLA